MTKFIGFGTVKGGAPQQRTGSALRGGEEKRNLPRGSSSKTVIVFQEKKRLGNPRVKSYRGGKKPQMRDQRRSIRNEPERKVAFTVSFSWKGRAGRGGRLSPTEKKELL